MESRAQLAVGCRLAMGNPWALLHSAQASLLKLRSGLFWALKRSEFGRLLGGRNRTPQPGAIGAPEEIPQVHDERTPSPRPNGHG